VLQAVGRGFEFDVFVAKYDRDGTLLWATSAGGAAGDGGHDIAIDHPGDIHVTGVFSDTATFGAGEGKKPSSIPPAARISS
jgi:hypothetical protein